MNDSIHSIRYPFAINKSLGTLQQETIFSQHVRQLMIQVLFTVPGERVNRPDFGCGIRRMVFAPNTDAAANLAQVMITQSLEKWVGDLITVQQVTVVSNNETMEISIVYLIKANQQKQYLNLEVAI
jgi:hypothetical protein